jgi:hypothetical protein
MWGDVRQGLTHRAQDSACATHRIGSVDTEVPARSADVTSHLLDEMAQHTQAEPAFPFGQNIINCNLFILSLRKVG